MFLFSLGVYPGVEMLCHMVILHLVSWGTSILFSIVVAPINIPINNVVGGPKGGSCYPLTLLQLSAPHECLLETVFPTSKCKLNILPCFTWEISTSRIVSSGCLALCGISSLLRTHLRLSEGRVVISDIFTVLTCGRQRPAPTKAVHICDGCFMCPLGWTIYPVI